MLKRALRLSLFGKNYHIVVSFLAADHTLIIITPLAGLQPPCLLQPFHSILLGKHGMKDGLGKEVLRSSRFGITVSDQIGALIARRFDMNEF